MKTKAAVAYATDKFTRSGADPEGLFPVIFGHAGHGVRRCAGPQRRSDAQGRVDPLGDHLLRTLRVFGARGALH